MTIICDLDDVLWDLVIPWILYYNNKYNDTIKYEDLVEYNLNNIPQITDKDKFFNVLEQDEFYDFMKKIQDKKVIDKNNKLIYNIKKYGFEFYVATSSMPNHSDKKISTFLSLYPTINPNEVIIIENKSLLNGDVFIDDKPETLLKVLNKNKSALTLKKPWTEKFYDNHKYLTNLLLFDKFYDIEEYLLD